MGAILHNPSNFEVSATSGTYRNLNYGGRMKKKLDDGTPLAFLNIQDAMGFNSILELMLVKLAEHGPLHGHHVSQLVGTL